MSDATGTVRWTLTDTRTGDSVTVPLNPNTMSPVGPRTTLKRTRGQYGVVSLCAVPTQVEFSFGGVMRSQAHYDLLLSWVDRRSVVVVQDHLGRRFRVYLTSFEPTDRSPTRTGLKRRWTYTVKAVLLKGPL